jgi:hypothetical protein
MDRSDWEEYLEENPDPVELLEALRINVVYACWRAAIEKNISDPMDRFPYTTKGVFEYKAPSAVLEAGRAKG